MCECAVGRGPEEKQISPRGRGGGRNGPRQAQNSGQMDGGIVLTRGKDGGEVATHSAGRLRALARNSSKLWKHLRQPNNSRICVCVWELGEGGNASGWWMWAVREASFNHCSLVKYTTVLPNCSAIMSDSDDWLQSVLTYSFYQCWRKLHLLIPPRDKGEYKVPSLSFYAKWGIHLCKIWLYL